MLRGTLSMSYNVYVDPRTRTVNKAAIAAGTPGVASAARWFWWIAGLSVINTVLIHNGSQTNFVIGLGFNLVADVVFKSVPVLAFVIGAVAVGFFILLGWLALRGYFWAFIVGALFYAIDALIYLKLDDMMSFGFHLFVLFFVVRGAFALRGAVTAAEMAAAEVETTPPPSVPPPLA